MFTLTMEVNQICNLECKYCYLGEKSGSRMDFATARESIDFAFQKIKVHKDRKLWFDFIGGEALLDYKTIKELVWYIENKNSLEDHPYELLFSTTTNATVLTKEIIDYLIDKQFSLKVSLDGRQEVNDSNRIAKQRYSVHDRILNKMGMLRDYENQTLKRVQVTNVITRNNYRDYFETFRYLVHDRGFRVIDTAIDLSIDWTGEQIDQIEVEIRQSLEWYLTILAQGKKVAWSFADSLLKLSRERKRFYCCGGGISSLYVRTDGSMFPCPACLKPEASIGHIKSGYDREKIAFIKNLKTIDNSRCHSCDMYERCTAKSCIMNNLEVNGDMNQPVPVLCRLWQLREHLYREKGKILMQAIPQEAANEA